MKNNSNKYIKIIQTRKYKDINLYLRFSINNKENTKACVCLLSRLLADVSDKYPSKLEMTRQKDMLYGINCDASYKVRSNITTFSVHYTFINPKFLDASIDEYNEFIKETLYNSLINEKTLKEAKTIICDSIKRRNDKPANKANERFIEIVARDNPEFINYVSNNDFIKSIKKTTLKQVKDTYRYLLNKAQLNIYLCGDLNSNDIKKLTDYSFENRIEVKLKNNKHTYKPKKMITDKKDISQSYLSVVYSTPFNKKHKDYFKWFMANCMLGVGPTSLLFSEIREKLSLCYHINSIDYKNEGIVRIDTSIDGKNKDLAIKEINRQVERLKNKDYAPAKLEMTKAVIINTLLGLYDDLDALVDYYTESTLSDFDYTIEEYCEKLNMVTMDDIADIYSKYTHYFDYLLLGSKDE